MNCVSSMVKYIIYIFNLIFVVCGILLIVLGSIMLSDMGDVTSFEDAVNTQTIPILIIVLGCIIFVVAFFGCCGAIRENNCCTMIYAIFMFILFCLQIALIVWVWVEFDDFVNKMSEVVTKAWEENDSAKGYPMDSLQMSFKCCGVKNYEDYTNSGKQVPTSCCGSLQSNTECLKETYEKRPGCDAEFRYFWTSNFNIIRYAGIGVALVELVALTFACCLSSNIRKSRGKF